MRAGATAASVRERAAIEVEREVVDLYRALYARALVGDQFEGTIVSAVGTGLYVALDDPFIDVLVRYESIGPDRYEPSEHELGVVGVRSGEQLMIGDRILVTIEDVAILRRAVYARRVPPAAAFRGSERGTERRPKRAGAQDSRGREATKGARSGRPATKSKERTARAPSTRGRRRR
jgi:ribonuclease R